MGDRRPAGVDLQSRPITALPAAHARSWDFPVTWEQDADRRLLWRRFEIDRAEPATPLEIDVSIAFCKAQADALPISVWPGAHVPTRLQRPALRRLVAEQLCARRRSHPEEGQGRSGRAAARRGKDDLGPLGAGIRAAIARLHAFDASTDDGAKLADHLEDAFGAFRQHWMIHWFPWVDDPDAEPLLRAFSALTGLEGEAARQGLAPLVEGEETILTRLIDGLYALAQTVAATPALAALVTDRPPGTSHARSSACRKRPDSAPRWRHSSNSMATTWAWATARRPASSGRRGDKTRRRCSRSSRRTCSQASACQRKRAPAPAPSGRPASRRYCAGADPAKAAEFQRWLPSGRREATLLEEHNYWIDQTSYAQLRTAVGYAARWLTERGSIAAEDDIFWLSTAEIVGALRSEAPTSQIARIADRRAEAAARRAQTPPPLLGLPDAHLEPGRR